jgi:hypothetical protein
MANAKSVLSCSSSHDLLHDRIPCGLANGAIGVAEDNAIFNKAFQKDELFLYDFKRDTLSEIVEQLLHSKLELQEKAYGGQSRLRSLRSEMGFESLFISET